MTCKYPVSDVSSLANSQLRNYKQVVSRVARVAKMAAANSDVRKLLSLAVHGVT